MVVRFVPNGRDHDRFGISTGRHLGGAVRRNRLRRRAREILRQAPPHGGPGRDILIVMRPPATDATFHELRAALERLLRSAHPPAGASA
jgi:ribonuclease P protein component